MHISSFLNNPDNDDFHSNQYAGGTESEEKFHERRAVDRKRQVIGRYQHSTLGNAKIARSDFSPLHRVDQPEKPERSVKNSALQQRNSSHVAVPKRGFQEPPRRNYNPYA